MTAMTDRTDSPADTTTAPDVPAETVVSLDKFRTVQGRPGGRPGRPADDTGRPGTLDNDAPVRPADQTPDDQDDTRDDTARPGTDDNDAPVHPADHTPDVPADAPDDQEDDPVSHRTALDGLSKAAQVRYVFDVLGAPSSAQVEEWLTAQGVSIDPAYVRRVTRRERAQRGLSDTSELPALTTDKLAQLDTGRSAQSAGENELGPDPAPAPPARRRAAEPVVLDPSAAELAAKVREAQARLPLQDDDALLRALSDDELAAERELAEWERATEREIRRSTKAAQLANARREQATAEHVAKSESADARWLQRAVSARRRLTSPDAKLAQLFRRAEWSSRALIGVVVLGMVWSGVNVQRNLVPDGNMADPLYWLSYGIEAMISVPLIVIMIAATTAARWGRSLNRRAVVPVELALLSITVGLNAGPHIGSGDLRKILEFAIAPVMVGVVIWLHAWVSQHYATLIEDSSAATSAPQDAPE